MDISMDPDVLREVRISMVRALLARLTDAERCEVFAVYCGHCGRHDPQCRCWDDD